MSVRGGKSLGAGTAYLCGLEKGPIKVGITTRRPSRRLKAAIKELGNDKVKLFGSWYFPHAYLIEKFAHMHLRKHHINGEWFKVKADIAREAIEDVVDMLTHPRLEPITKGNWFDRFGICPKKVRKTFGEDGDIVISQWNKTMKAGQSANSLRRAAELYSKIEAGATFKDLQYIYHRHPNELETMYFNEKWRREREQAN